MDLESAPYSLLIGSPGPRLQILLNAPLESLQFQLHLNLMNCGRSLHGDLLLS